MQFADFGPANFVTTREWYIDLVIDTDIFLPPTLASLSLSRANFLFNIYKSLIRPLHRPTHRIALYTFTVPIRLLGRYCISGSTEGRIYDEKTMKLSFTLASERVAAIGLPLRADTSSGIFRSSRGEPFGITEGKDSRRGVRACARSYL